MTEGSPDYGQSLLSGKFRGSLKSCSIVKAVTGTFFTCFRQFQGNGKPADVVEAVAAYNQKLQESELPKMLFYATPGALVPAPMVEWSRQNLKNLKTVDIGPGLHFLQEDNPHVIGSELANWYKTL